MKKIITTAGIFAIASASTSAYAYSGEYMARQAVITIEQARIIAHKAFPGKIMDEELEKENGGSGLRYSFDIKKGKIEQEVGVDAKSGALLENDRETSDKEVKHHNKD